MANPHSPKGFIDWGSASVLSLLFGLFALACGMASDLHLPGIALATGAIAAVVLSILMLNYLNGRYVR